MFSSFKKKVFFHFYPKVKLFKVTTFFFRSPVCLDKVDKSISTRKPGLYDLKVTSATRISVASRQLDFRYEQPEDKVLTITEIKALQAFQKVNFTN